MLAARRQPTKAFTETDLGFPAHLLEPRRQVIDPRLDVRRDLGGMAVRPGRFDKGAPRARIARFS